MTTYDRYLAELEANDVARILSFNRDNTKTVVTYDTVAVFDRHGELISKKQNKGRPCA